VNNTHKHVPKFSSARQKAFELNKSTVPFRSENFWNCEQGPNVFNLPTSPNCLYSVLPLRQKLWNLSTKATQIDCVLPRRLKFWNNKHGILFSRIANESTAFWLSGACAAKNFANKSTVFCSAAQRNLFELRTKALYFVQPQRKTFELRTKELKFCSAAQRKILEFTLKSISNQRYSVQDFAAKIVGICQQKQLELTAFCSAAQRKTLESHCILFSRAKNFGIANKITFFCSGAQRIDLRTSLNLYCVQPREKVWNCEQSTAKTFWICQ
jgi:hypothetical protein